MTSPADVSVESTMSEEIDIGQMISNSTADISVNDLSRRGFKKVKVLNQKTIQLLIMQAVDRVISQKEDVISRTERQKVYEESRHEFENLMRQRLDEVKEQTRRSEEELQTRSRAVTLLEQEVAGLREDLAAKAAEATRAEEEAGEARREADELRQEVANLREELAGKVSEATQAVGATAELRHEADGLREQLEGQTAQTERVTQEAVDLREQLNGKAAEAARAEEEIAKLREEVARLREEVLRLQREIERAASEAMEKKKAAAGGELTSVFREFIHEMRESTTERENRHSGELKKTMELLADRIAKSVAAAGGGRGPGGPVSSGDPTEDVMAAFLSMGEKETLESNISKVGTKKAQAKKGVASSLEKLKSMQKSGGTQGGS